MKTLTTNQEIAQQARAEEREHTLAILKDLAERTNSPNIYLALQAVYHSPLSGE